MFKVEKRSKTGTKRLTKAKNDITSRMINSMERFVLLSEIIKISNITPNKISETNNRRDKKYIREIYSNQSREIIRSTLTFNLIRKKYVLQYFKALQRDLTSDIFSPDTMKRLLDAIFTFHPQCIISQNIGGYKIYSNADDITDTKILTKDIIVTYKCTSRTWY